jgi:hypothetical protein
LALEAVRKILNTEPVPQQALIFVDSPRRVDIVIEKVRFSFLPMILVRLDTTTWHCTFR